MSMATTMEPVAKEVEVPGRMPGQTKLNCYAIPLDLKVHGEVLAQKLEEAKKMPEIKGREANFSAPKGIPHCTFAFVETEPLFHLCHAFVQKLNINQTQDIKLGKLICFPVYDDMTKQKDTLAVVVQVISDKITQGHFEFMKQHKLQPKYRIDPKDPESPEDYNPHVTLGFFPKEATLQMTAIEFEEWTKVNRCDTCLKFKKELKARVAGVVHIYPSECKCSPIEFESDRDPEPEDFVPDTFTATAKPVIDKVDSDTNNKKYENTSKAKPKKSHKNVEEEKEENVGDGCPIPRSERFPGVLYVPHEGCRGSPPMPDPDWVFDS